MHWACSPALCCSRWRRLAPCAQPIIAVVAASRDQTDLAAAVLGPSELTSGLTRRFRHRSPQRASSFSVAVPEGKAHRRDSLLSPRSRPIPQRPSLAHCRRRARPPRISKQQQHQHAPSPPPQPSLFPQGLCRDTQHPHLRPLPKGLTLPHTPSPPSSTPPLL